VLKNGTKNSLNTGHHKKGRTLYRIELIPENALQTQHRAAGTIRQSTIKLLCDSNDNEDIQSITKNTINTVNADNK